MAGVQNIVQALSHYRHDFLNDIQLIKSYLALGKLETVDAVLEKIIYRAEQESRLSSLHMPAFAEKLLTYNWHSPKVPAEIEINAGNDNWAVVEQHALTIFNRFTGLVEKKTKLGEDRQLLIILQQLENKELALEYTGMEISQSMKEHTEIFLRELDCLMEADISSDTIYFRVALQPEKKREEK
ncbi:Spo0B domain-containing protein [Alkalicoccus daliensis]|uniref:Stage 0 sporulation protein B (Sporulation initiation phosphotransferase) n=1 Tax=Alkalicoccus daliensis TaxID=745820 RepID=A0A1H0BMB2_9BACI|nr:Spo0B domain-containing protein [Alkalicoccus daliensis]SDN46695.1 stage 0 sporulation protein B (sporulation initiation phosphotransferase) [Alkalicoccus daliensis]